MPAVKSGDLLRLIEKRHEKDVFVPECKDGPTQSASHVRIDAWAMRRSWSNPCVTGYEIKVSRSDFLADDKWTAYLPCCNVLYFVCPTGVIRPEEVSPSAGLLWMASTGRTLITKKKAPFRELEVPESVYRYILMCRTRITRDTNSGEESNAEYWQKWLEEKKEHRRLGYRASRTISEFVEETRRENRELKERYQRYDDIRAMLKELGFTEPDKEWVSRHSVSAKINKITEIVPPWFAPTLKRIEEQCASIRSEIERHPNVNSADSPLPAVALG